MRRRATLFAMLALASRASGQPRPTPEEGSDVRGTEAFGSAVAERLVACVEAEGNTVSPADREVLRDVSQALGPVVARSLCGDDCDDDARTRDECAARVRGLSCDELSTRLRPGPARGEAPAWASGLGRAIASRVGACAVEERDGQTLDDDERRALADFEGELASALGSLTASGACVVNENALPACAMSVSAASCGGLGARLEDDVSALGRTVTPTCAAMFRCGAAALEDGGVDEEDAPSPAGASRATPL